jgi:hypothetical protein
VALVAAIAVVRARVAAIVLVAFAVVGVLARVAALALAVGDVRAVGTNIALVAHVVVGPVARLVLVLVIVLTEGVVEAEPGLDLVFFIWKSWESAIVASSVQAMVTV